MGLGVTINYDGFPPRGIPLSQKLAEPGVVAVTVAAARGALPLIQGEKMAVAPMADTSTDMVAPPIPGGLQMEKVVVVTTAQPVKINPDLPPWFWY